MWTSMFTFRAFRQSHFQSDPKRLVTHDGNLAFNDFLFRISPMTATPMTICLFPVVQNRHDCRALDFID